MTSEQPQQNPSPLSQAKFDPNASRQQRPQLRPVRGFPVQVQNEKGEQGVMLGLADARQISDKMVMLPMAAQFVLPLMDGKRSLQDIVGEVGRGLTLEITQQIVAQLDDAGLLIGPKFDAMLRTMQEEFDSSAVLPPAATAQFADALVVGKLGEGATEEQRASEGPGLLRETFDQWIAAALKDVENPSLNELPVGVIVPHIDYPRGWANYAHVWGRLRVTERPDRVVILGTNHFGMGTGVTACDKGYTTPLGTTQVDRRLLDAVLRRLGPQNGTKLLANRFDHEREHSIELQVPWVQHVFGKSEASGGDEGGFVPVLGVLVHDPSVNAGESYDGQGLGLDPFIEALRGALEEVGGKTLVVSSADLSHVGPMFGDQQTLAGDEEPAQQARNKVIQHDQEMIGLISQIKPDDLVASMAWQQNPTRWCSIGNIVAMLKTVRPERIELLQYMGAMDPQGQGLVSSIAAIAH